MKAVWSLARGADGALYAGVEPAGLFRSDDGGESWSHIEGLQQHPTRPDWNPGGAGLILHSLVPDPADARKIWVGISAAGVFATEDGGASWQTRNRGTRADFMPEGQNYPEFGQCVHCLVDGAGRQAVGSTSRTIAACTAPTMAARRGRASRPACRPPSASPPPRIRATRICLYLIPLNGDIKGRFMPEGNTAVWRTTDAGKSWQPKREGLPQGGAYFNVLRQAMATDTMEPAGVYFGTNAGGLYASIDEGESWDCVAPFLPTITSVETLVIER